MRHSRWQGAALSGRVSRSRAMPVGGPHRENWPALQAVRVASSVGVRAETGAIPTIGVCAAAALRAAVPTGGRRSKPSPRFFAISDGSFAALQAAVPGSTGRTARRSAFQGVLALVLGLWCAALTLVGWSVIGAGFALPRDAGRRPALLAVPALVLGLWCAALTVAGWSVIGTGFALPRDAGLKTGAPGRARHSRWREGALSVLVSRSRAMPV